MRRSTPLEVGGDDEHDQHKGGDRHRQAWVMSIVHRAAVARAHEPGVRRCSSVPPGVGAAAGSCDEILAQLSTLEWASVELAYFGGRRHTEVAGVLGLTAGTAQVQIRDGLQRVRLLMDAV